MTVSALFWPDAAMALLTFAVWISLYVERIGEMRTRRIGAQSVATSALAAQRLTRTHAADNFRNLFELPVLFYVGTVLAMQARLESPLLLALAWGFVALRYVHSAIHVTYNRVMHRFSVHVTGAVVLWTFWCVLVARAWQA